MRLAHRLNHPTRLLVFLRPDLDALVRRRGFELPRLPEDDRRRFDPIPKLGVGRSALLLLHGIDDDLILPREAQEAFDAAGSSMKNLVFVPDRGHNDVSASQVYWDAIGAFVRATAS